MRNEKRKFVKTYFMVTLFLLLICKHLLAQDISKRIILTPEFSTLYSSFVRIVEKSSDTDTVKGEIYFISPSKVYLDIAFPLRQIMIIEGNITTIYYPELERAFKLESNNPAILPVLPGLIGALRPDYGLSEFGFEIYEQKLNGDTLFTYWSHPKASNKIGRFRLAQKNDRLIAVLHESPDSLTQIKTSFADYISIGGIMLPTLMVTEIRSLKENAMEKLLLTNIRLNIPIPERIANFRIPKHVRIEKRQW